MPVAKSNPNYFKHVRISAVALLKMTMHARSGGTLEIMGLMIGKLTAHTFIVTDSYALPVEGTETRVNAQAEAYEYMGAYTDSLQASGREETVVGWYHSHPGYGCWLSGIDVATEATYQKFSDPFLAVVIDPDRTISAGKVEIGAFRTYPDDYKPTNSSSDDDGGSYQTIPLAKIEDFGAHSSKYYPLEVTHFKSTLDASLLDLLWNKYWVQTLSQSPLVANRDYGTKQMRDLAQKVGNYEDTVQRGARGVPLRFAGKGAAPGAAGDKQLEQVVKDSTKITSEELTGLFSNVVKERVFGGLSKEKVLGAGAEQGGDEIISGTQ